MNRTYVFGGFGLCFFVEYNLAHPRYILSLSLFYVFFIYIYIFIRSCFTCTCIYIYIDFSNLRYPLLFLFHTWTDMTWCTIEQLLENIITGFVILKLSVIVCIISICILNLVFDFEFNHKCTYRADAYVLNALCALLFYV